MRAAAALVCLLLAACEPPLVVPLARPASIAPRPEASLEVTTRSSGVRDPLPVRGSRVAYADLEANVGLAALSSASPWAEAHRREGARYHLALELVSAEARYDGQRLDVAIGCRATLRAQPGNSFVAQTQLRCDEGALVASAADGAPLFAACARSIGRGVAGWLAGVAPAPVADSIR